MYVRRLASGTSLAIIKNRLDAQQFKLRGIANVRADSTRDGVQPTTLWRVWRIRTEARSAFA